MNKNAETLNVSKPGLSQTRDSSNPRHGVWRSIWAVFAGFLVVVILSIGADEALRAAGMLAPLGRPTSDAIFLPITIYRTIFGVLGSYVTARLAPDRPMGHALIGGAIGLVLSIAGVVVSWNAGPEFGPRWYPIALAVLALPGAWLGGKLRLAQLRKR
jgi:hypothetical protein